MTRRIHLPALAIALLAIVGATVPHAPPAQAAAELSLAGEITLTPPLEPIRSPTGSVWPVDAAVDADGFIYAVVGDFIQRYEPTGRLVDSWGGIGSAPGQFLPSRDGYTNGGPVAIDVDAAGRVYAADAVGNRVVVYTREGDFIAYWGANGGDGSPGDRPGEFQQLRDLAAGPSGELAVLDWGRQWRLQLLSSTGSPIASVDALGLTRIAVADDGSVYAREFQEVVRHFAAGSLEPLPTIALPDPPRTGSRATTYPSCCDVALLGGWIWVGQVSTSQIERFAPDGTQRSTCALLPPGRPIFAGTANALVAGRDGYLYSIPRSGQPYDLLRLRVDDPVALPCAPRIPRPRTVRTRVRDMSLLLRGRSVRSVRLRDVPKLKLDYGLDKVGFALLRVNRFVPGRRVNGGCWRMRASIARRPGCMRRRSVTRVRLPGEIFNRRDLTDDVPFGLLRPGRYELKLVAYDGYDGISPPLRLRWRIRR